MTEPKNIVIKVKYTAPDDVAQAPPAQPRMITEWNIKRIASALGVVILLLAGVLFLLLSSDTDKVKNQVAPTMAPASTSPTSEAKPQESPAVVATTPAAPGATLKPSQSPSTPVKTSHNGRIRRAALAYRIIDKEPADLIGSTISVSKDKPVLVHYFTEVRGKAHQTLFHEWRKDGQMILRHPVTIGAERWRTSSQRQLDWNDRGFWSVRTVDDKGGIFNEMQFTVSAK